MANAGHDVFICYARKSGAELAQLFRAKLEARGMRVFLDVEADYWGPFPAELKTRLRQTPHVLVPSTAGCLASRWMQHELEQALETSRKILVVRRADFEAPDPGELQPPWAQILMLNHVPYAHEFSDEVIERVFGILSVGPRATSDRHWVRRYAGPAAALALVSGSVAYASYRVLAPTDRPPAAPASTLVAGISQEPTRPSPPAPVEAPITPAPAPMPAPTPAPVPARQRSPAASAAKSWCYTRRGYDPMAGQDRSECAAFGTLTACKNDRNDVLVAGSLWTEADRCLPCRCESP